MNCVGIDVSKGKSMIAVMRPLGEMVIPPFEVGHTDAELCELSRRLGDLDGETRVVMEATGNYHLPVASFLYDSGFYVSVVNAMLVHSYGNNSLRRAKTDKKDAIKLANYGLDHWLAMPRYIPEDEVRLMLKTTYRQYQQCAKVQTMLKNNLISLLDTAFPDANRLFTSPARADGSEKWIDFVAAFPHYECVCGLSEKAFTTKYQKLDAVKIANYCLDRWTDLERYTPADQIRQTLKTCRRQYDQYIRLKVNLKNNLIALLDGTFPGLNTLFKSAPRDTDGHEKWVDFAGKFWHCQCVCGNSEKAFANQYRKWCAKAGYRFSAEKAAAIYAHAGSQVDTLPMTSAIQCLITHAVVQLNMIIETISAIQHEMLTLASQLPEYPIVMQMFGVGPVLGPQLMAEIGDVRRFHCKQSLVAFAGVDAPPCQSGTFESKNRHISKRGSPRLRKTLFQVMSTIIQHAPADDPVFQFLDRKRREGKHYYVYMTAAANKFLRIYYGTVMAYLKKL